MKKSPFSNAEDATTKGRKLAVYLIEKLNEYIHENFTQDGNVEDDLIVVYGIDVFFSDCVFNNCMLFKPEKQSMDEFIQERMSHLTDFMRCKAKGIGVT